MKTERESAAIIDAAQKNYHEQSSKLTAIELAALSDDIAKMKKEHHTLLAEGANPCPNCGNDPIGMKKGKGEYEIGCVVCAPVEKDGMKLSISVRAEYLEDAIEKWNKGEFLVQPIESKK